MRAQSSRTVMTHTAGDVEAAWEHPVPVNATLRVDGIFDVGAALKLREAIALLPQSERVLVDFTRTRECHDFALAALVHALATMNRTGVVTRGLSQHQHRLLRYLGEDTLG